MTPRGRRRKVASLILVRIYIAKKEKVFYCIVSDVSLNIKKSCVRCGEHFPENKIFCANCGKMLVIEFFSVRKV